MEAAIQAHYAALDQARVLLMHAVGLWIPHKQAKCLKL